MRRQKRPQFLIKAACAATLACFTPPAFANPEGGVVVSGNATFDQQGNNLIIRNTNGSIINWNSFNIAPGELTRFIQNSSDSAVLNRVVGGDPSQILGALQSNGRVFLINPNGIVFAQGAQIDTAGLMASTLNIRDEDFQAGRLRFEGAATGSVRNAATLTTPAGGFVYLIAPEVQNTGVIVSPKGEVLLAAGQSVELVDGVDTSLRVKLTAPAGQVLNVGQLIAEQGRIGLFATAIAQQGIVAANRAEVGADGRVVFKGDTVTLATGSQTRGGSVLVDATTNATVEGDIDARNLVGKGGDIRVMGHTVLVNGTLDASGRNGGGQILVGGDYQGKNPLIRNAAFTTLGERARLRADAMESGAGGRIIAWADDTTVARGRIEARGGAAGGDGGFAEVSGKNKLMFSTSVDLSAVRGKFGTLLLDPQGTWICNGESFIDCSNPMAASLASIVDANALFTAAANVNLNSSASIVIDNSVGTRVGLGSISLYAAGGDIRLDPNVYLQADGDVTFFASGYADIIGNLSSGRTLSLQAETGNIAVSGSLAAPAIQLLAGYDNRSGVGSVLISGRLSSESLSIISGGSIGSVTAPLVLSAYDLRLITTGTGSGIWVNTQGGAAQLTSNGGVIQFTGSGASTVSASSGGGAISLVTTSGGLTLSNVSGGAVTAKSAAGLTVEGTVTGSGVTLSGATLNGMGVVSGNSITLSSSGGIGSKGNRLKVNAGSTLNASVSGAGGLYLEEQDGVERATLSTTHGEIDFLAGGATSVDTSAGGVGSSLSLQTRAGDLTVLSAVSGGDLSLQAGGALIMPTGMTLSAANVLLRSMQGFNLASNLVATGALTLDTPGSIQTAAGVSITGSTLTLRAQQGIGSAGQAANVQTGSLIAEVGAGAGLYINALGNLGSAKLNAAGGPIVLGIAGAGGTVLDLSNTGNGDRRIQVKSQGNLSGSVNGGLVELTTTGALGGATQALNLTAASLVLDAGKDANVQGQVAGTAMLTAGADLSFSGLAVGGQVNADATGSILTTSGGSGPALTAARAVLNARGGAIQLASAAVDRLDATAKTNVQLANIKPLTVDKVHAGGNVTLSSKGGLTTTGAVVSGGSVDLSTQSPLTIGQGGIQAQTGIKLASGTGNPANDGITLNGVLSTAGGDCRIDAGGGVQQNADILLGGAGTLAVTAAAGPLTMAAGVKSASAGGLIAYQATGDIVLGLLDAGATGGVMLASSGGNVGAAVPGQINVRAGSLNIKASGGIELGADVPADKLSFSSGSGYILVRGKEGEVLPGSTVGNQQSEAIQGQTSGNLDHLTTTVGDHGLGGGSKTTAGSSGSSASSSADDEQDQRKKAKKC